MQSSDITDVNIQSSGGAMLMGVCYRCSARAQLLRCWINFPMFCSSVAMCRD